MLNCSSKKKDDINMKYYDWNNMFSHDKNILIEVGVSGAGKAYEMCVRFIVEHLENGNCFKKLIIKYISEHLNICTKEIYIDNLDIFAIEQKINYWFKENNKVEILHVELQ